MWYEGILALIYSRRHLLSLKLILTGPLVGQCSRRFDMVSLKMVPTFTARERVLTALDEKIILHRKK